MPACKNRVTWPLVTDAASANPVPAFFLCIRVAPRSVEEPLLEQGCQIGLGGLLLFRMGLPFAPALDPLALKHLQKAPNRLAAAAQRPLNDAIAPSKGPLLLLHQRGSSLDVQVNSVRLPLTLLGPLLRLLRPLLRLLLTL